MPPVRKSTRERKPHRTISDYEIEILRTRLHCNPQRLRYQKRVIAEMFAELGPIWGDNASIFFDKVFHDVNWARFHNIVIDVIRSTEVHYHGIEIDGHRRNARNIGRWMTHFWVFEYATKIKITFDVTNHANIASRKVMPTTLVTGPNLAIGNMLLDTIRQFKHIEYLTLDCFLLEEHRANLLLHAPVYAPALPDLDVIIPRCLQAACCLYTTGQRRWTKQNRLRMLSVIVPAGNVVVNPGQIMPDQGVYGSEGPSANKLWNVEMWLKNPTRVNPPAMFDVAARCPTLQQHQPRLQNAMETLPWNHPANAFASVPGAMTIWAVRLQ